MCSEYLKPVQTISNMISNFALISNILNLLFILIKVINSDIDFCDYRLCQSRYWALFQSLSSCLFIPQYKSFRLPYIIALKEPYFVFVVSSPSDCYEVFVYLLPYLDWSICFFIYTYQNYIVLLARSLSTFCHLLQRSSTWRKTNVTIFIIKYFLSDNSIFLVIRYDFVEISDPNILVKNLKNFKI